VKAAGFKYYVTEMVCWATGGPQKYTGRAMSESHKHLKITEGEWAAFCKDFDDTMAKFNVPEAEPNELFAIVQSTKNRRPASCRKAAASIDTCSGLEPRMR
jgi:hemoglobin